MRHSGLADPGLVPQGNAHVHHASNQTGTGKKSASTAGEARRTASSVQIPVTPSMLLIRQQLSQLDLPSDTIDILLASWRKTTGKQYNTYLSKWLLYCKENNVDTTRATVTEGLAFLTYLYKQGLGYSAILKHCPLGLVICHYPRTTVYLWRAPTRYSIS